MRKIVSFFLIAVFLITPVSAASSSSSDVEYIQKASFWTWAAGQNEFLHGLVGSTGASCPSAEDGYHHASSYRRPEASWGGLTGYYKCICDLCGAEFKAYESDLQQSYDAQVAELPATGYSSDGGLLIPYHVLDHCVMFRTSSSHWSYLSSCSNHTNFTGGGGSSSSGTAFLYTYSCELNSVSFKVKSGSSGFGSVGFTYRLRATIPYNGYYSYLLFPVVIDYVTVSGETGTVSTSSVMDDFSPPVYYDSGEVVSYASHLSSNRCYLPLDLNYFSAVAHFEQPLLKYISSPSSDLNFEITYNIQSRPTSITGDYGIIGDNGQIIKVEGDKIVNETNNNYFNPATGETTTITDWSYNYEDRSYTVTTEAGDTVTITYGDENVTIVEGDTIYNIYYLVDGSGSENPGPDVPPTCDHTWTETSRTDPTCSTPGKVTFTCSKCSQTKTETLPALGHNWTVERTVQTSYDEQGNLVQQGYTIYSCTVCGEQYKDMEGTGPPGAEGDKSLWEQLGDLIGSGLGGILQLIEAVVGKFLDALTALVTMITDKLSTVVEAVLSIFEEVPAMFGGFLAFLEPV